MNAAFKKKIIDEIQHGAYEVSIVSLQKAISGKPEDIEAKMMFGLCCQMAGEESECLRIYEEVRPQMELREASGEQSEIVSFWQKYRKLVAALLVVGVIPFCNAADSVVTNTLGNVSIVCHSDAGEAIPPAVPTNVCSVVKVAYQMKMLPRGVQNIKYKDGVISTFVVVGKAAIPKALRKNPGRASQYGGEKLVARPSSSSLASCLRSANGAKPPMVSRL